LGFATIAGFADIILRHLKETIMASAKPKKKNPRLASGRKRVRQDIKINAANTSLRSKYRTAVKNVEKAVLAGDKTKATELFAKMQAVVDTIADKGIFHKNKAARDKSRLSTKVKALALAA
jgi:small subunit ribosomal protein S20